MLSENGPLSSVFPSPMSGQLFNGTAKSQVQKNVSFPYSQNIQQVATSNKKEYRRLNDLELTGVRAEIVTYQKKFKQDSEPKTHAKLLEFQLRELQHCYQIKKDLIEEKDKRISALDKDLFVQEMNVENANNQYKILQTQKRKRDEEYEGLQRDVQAKVRKIEETNGALKIAHNEIQNNRLLSEKQTREYKILSNQYSSLNAQYEQALKGHQASMMEVEEQRVQVTDLTEKLVQEELNNQTFQAKIEELNQLLKTKEEECTRLKFEKGTMECKYDTANKRSSNLTKTLSSIQQTLKSQCLLIDNGLESQDEMKT